MNKKIVRKCQFSGFITRNDDVVIFPLGKKVTILGCSFGNPDQHFNNDCIFLYSTKSCENIWRCNSVKFHICFDLLAILI